MDDLRVGICGLGFMGKMHYDAVTQVPGVRVSAIATRDEKKRRGDWSDVVGNIATSGAPVDLTGVHMHETVEALIHDPKVDIVDITLPTGMHMSTAALALTANKPVICEKPLALDPDAAARTVAAFAARGLPLYPAHCIRFWPDYAVARELILSGRYGRVLRAHFCRLSTRPRWSRGGWILQAEQSGGPVLDLHIHDADFVQFVFGMPAAVSSRAATFGAGVLDHIHTTYLFDDREPLLVTAEGGWMSAPGAEFTMNFRIELEAATLTLGWGEKPDRLAVYTRAGATVLPELPAGDGYTGQLAYFARCWRQRSAPTLATPESAVASLRLVAAEMASARSGGARVIVPAS